MSPFYYPLLIGHGLLTIFMAFGWISNNRIILKILFALLLVGISLFFMLGGCFLTRLEKKLSGSDFTILDPLLNALGIHINRQTRTHITIGIFMVSLVITSYKLLLF